MTVSVTGRFGAVCVCLLATVLVGVALVPAVSVAMPSEEPFAVVPESFKFTLSDYRAGVHADWTFAWDFAHNSKEETYNDLKDTVVNVPAGFMGNANRFAFPRCTLAQLFGKDIGRGECPVASQIGTISF